MLVSEKFTFLHMPKTAGTFVSEALGELCKNSGEKYKLYGTGVRDIKTTSDKYSKHAFLSDLPRDLLDRPVILCIRNPLSHYVSHYNFKWWKSHKNSMFKDSAMKKRFPKYPDLTFKEFMEAIFDWKLSPKSDAKDMENANVGMLTRQYLRFCFRNYENIMSDLERSRSDVRFNNFKLDKTAIYPNLYILHSENVSRELPKLLKKIGYSNKQVAFIKDMGEVLPEHPQKEKRQENRPSYLEYYDKDLIKRVLQKDRMIFEMFPEYKPNLLDYAKLYVVHSDWFKKLKHTDAFEQLTKINKSILCKVQQH